MSLALVLDQPRLVGHTPWPDARRPDRLCLPRLHQSLAGRPGRLDSVASDLTLRGDVRSWGRFPRLRHHTHALWDRDRPLPAFHVPVLPYGNGRSYGDVCLNDGG